MRRTLLPDRIALSKLILFPLALLPFALLLWRGYGGNLGANPIETITDETGIWILRFLLLTLAITPLRRLTGWNWFLRYRRMAGLFAFFYATLHFATYAWLDQGLDWPFIVADISEHPYVIVGFTGFLLLIPLALTSTRAMMRRLGRRWQSLHRLAYAVPLLGGLHFLWLVKSDIREPLLYLLLYAMLMAARWPGLHSTQRIGERLAAGR